ncbi:MAG: ABC transporter permease subunit [Thermomicrobiales bacterium]
MLPITSLTLRQFRRGKSLFVVIGIYAFSLLFALIRFLPGSSDALRDTRSVMGEGIYLGIVTATLLPLATLILATAALGDEIEDKTLQYLSLKPISRTRIVLEKFVAVMLVSIPIAWIMLIITYLVQCWGYIEDTNDFIVPILASSTVGILGFGALFMLISMLIQRALLVGIFYVFVWESALSRFLPGIRSISVRHYSQSLFVRMLDDRRIEITGPSATTTVLVTITLLVTLCVILATVRMRSMNLE